MGHRVRSVLTRLSPLSWTAAVILAVIQMAGARVGGAMVIVTGLAAAGTISGAVQATHDASIDMLVRALAEQRRPTPGPRPQLHQVERAAA